IYLDIQNLYGFKAEERALLIPKEYASSKSNSSECFSFLRPEILRYGRGSKQQWNNFNNYWKNH
ncbi:MAG: hypothetical protein ACKVJP_02340, partial [Flavobacteriales bacterium]